MLNNDEKIKINAFASTNFIIENLKERNIKDLTNLKLQKLLYFAYGIHLAHFSKNLFNSQIQAWHFGPVIPDVYFEFKDRGGRPIDLDSRAYVMKDYNFIQPVFSKEQDKQEVKSLSLACDVFGNQSASALVDLTHQEGSAWDIYYKKGVGTPIENKEIKNEFKLIIDKYFERV